MAKASHQNTGPAIMTLSLILLAVIAVVGWLIWPEPPAAPDQPPPDNTRQSERPDNPAPLQPRNPQSEPGQPDELEPTPEIDREPVDLPFLSRFRALVLEADSALAVRDDPDAPADELWKHASTLEQLESRFAPFAIAAMKDANTPEDRRHFTRDATNSFERPDVAGLDSRSGSSCRPVAPPGRRVPDRRNQAARGSAHSL